MVEVKHTPDEIRKVGVYQLARMAGLGAPDDHDSPGGKWLVQVRNVAEEIVENESEETGDVIDGDMIGEYADGVVPIYTHELWETWTDLQGYRFDGELRLAHMEDSGNFDIESIPKADLYEASENIIYQLISGDYDN
jgi:hypothetical protein